MLKAIFNFFEQNLSQEAVVQDQEHRLRLATAALLVEMINQDDQVLDSERRAVRQILKDKFALNDDETQELCQLAEEELHDATDYYQFTRLIAEHFSQPQKIQIIELLWRVAYADRQLDAYEEHMVRRIAELIYVPHQAFIQAKLKVLKEQEQG